MARSSGANSTDAQHAEDVARPGHRRAVAAAPGWPGRPRSRPRPAARGRRPRPPRARPPARRRPGSAARRWPPGGCRAWPGSRAPRPDSSCPARSRRPAPTARLEARRRRSASCGSRRRTGAGRAYDGGAQPGSRTGMIRYVYSAPSAGLGAQHDRLGGRGEQHPGGAGGQRPEPVEQELRVERRGDRLALVGDLELLLGPALVVAAGGQRDRAVGELQPDRGVAVGHQGDALDRLDQRDRRGSRRSRPTRWAAASGRAGRSRRAAAWWRGWRGRSWCRRSR